MKSSSLYCLLLAWLFISCNRGVYITIDSKKYNYGKNTIVKMTRQDGTPIGYGFDVKTFKKSDTDSSFFLFGVGRANIPITAGDYSFPNVDMTNSATSGIDFYDNNRKIYASGGDEIYGSTFVITSLTKKRAKGYFKGKLVDKKADTVRPSNTIYVEGRFNVSLKNVQHQ
jgi:hypothetical protein